MGIPLGVLLVRTMPSEILVRGLGAFLLAFGLYRLLALLIPTLKRLNWAYGFGLVAGVLGGVHNTGGPPLVVYATMNRWPPVTFRATPQGCFVVTGLGVLISYGLGGLLTAQVLQLFALSIPVVIPAIWLGAWINRHMPMQRFEQILFVILIILGIMLLV